MNPVNIYYGIVGLVHPAHLFAVKWWDIHTYIEWLPSKKIVQPGCG